MVLCGLILINLFAPKNLPTKYEKISKVITIKMYKLKIMISLSSNLIVNIKNEKEINV